MRACPQPVFTGIRRSRGVRMRGALAISVVALTLACVAQFLNCLRGLDTLPNSISLKGWTMKRSIIILVCSFVSAAILLAQTTRRRLRRLKTSYHHPKTGTPRHHGQDRRRHKTPRQQRPLLPPHPRPPRPRRQPARPPPRRPPRPELPVPSPTRRLPPLDPGPLAAQDSAAAVDHHGLRPEISGRGRGQGAAAQTR